MAEIVQLLVGAFVVGLLGWAAWAAWQGRRRRAGLGQAFSQLGLRFASADNLDLQDFCVNLHLFGLGHSRLGRNFAYGQLDNQAVRFFDYQYETGFGTTRRTHHWQVALVQTQYGFPALLVQPRSRHDPLEALFGLDEVSFQAEPFASKFHVACDDRQFAYQMLHPRTADLLVSQPDVTLETRDSVLCLCRPGLASRKQAAELLRLACQLPTLIPPQLAQELRQEPPA